MNRWKKFIELPFVANLNNETASTHDEEGATLVNHWQRGVPVYREPVVTRALLFFAALAAVGLTLALVLRPLDYVTELVSGPLACELPLDVNPVAIHTTIPGPSLLAQASDVSDSAFA